jgi:hypothetical protein
MKNIYKILAIVFITYSNAFGQMPFESTFGFKYDVNVPLSNRSFLKNTSYIGFELDGKWMINDNIAAGLSLSWASYYQYEARQTYSGQGVDVTTDLYKNVYTVPILLTGTYFFDLGDQVIPYATLAMGTSYVNHKLLFNIYEGNSYSWGFDVRPEIGALFMVNPNTAISLSSRYNYMTNKESDLDYKNFQTLGFQVGIVLTQ